MKKQIKSLTEKEIENVCDAREECKGCPLGVIIDDEGLVCFCAADITIIDSNGLRKLADKLEEEINIEEIES